MSGRWAIRGRIVTMDDAQTVVPQGTLYIDGERIAGVGKAGQPAPAGFEQAKAVDTQGTIYPGLIELHNHLSYDVLRLWQVPKTYTNRSQWQNATAYKRAVTAPMSVLAKADDGRLLAAIVRYVECKCLLGGVTSSQGITLSNWSGEIHRYYKGVFRAVEIGGPNLPHAQSHIQDVAAADWDKFYGVLQAASCLLLHLSEGVDAEARSNFLSLYNKDKDKWAVTKALAGIHCTALQAADFEVMAKNGASTIWSPLSNLLLYGQTTDIAAARKAGVRLALGSDWSPSGSKNLLGELKAARIHADHANLAFSDYDIVSLATRNPAAILGWNGQLGSLETGKLADLLVVAGTDKDPYRQLIDAKDAAVGLVAVGGRPRYGTAAIMKALAVTGETLTVGGAARVLDLDDPQSDPDIEKLTLADATTHLAAALKGLPQSKSAQEAMLLSAQAKSMPIQRHTKWRLALEEQEHHNVELRPRLEIAGVQTGPSLAAVKAEDVKVDSMTLDPLTIADDTAFAATFAAEINVPDYMKTGLKAYWT